MRFDRVEEYLGRARVVGYDLAPVTTMTGDETRRPQAAEEQGRGIFQPAPEPPRAHLELLRRGRRPARAVAAPVGSRA